MKRNTPLLAIAAAAGVMLTAVIPRMEATASAAPQPAALQKLRVYGDGDDVDLFKVKGAAYRGADLVVVTAPEPAVHVFRGTHVSEWGKKGSGPAELSDPSAIAISGDNILVSDLRLSKIVSYTPSGRFVSARQVGIISALQTAGADTLVSSVDLRGGVRTVLRLRGERHDTVLSYRLPEQITLRASGSPDYTVVPPYAPVPQWTALPGGGVVYWDGTAPFLSVRLLGRRGERRLPVPGPRQPLTTADRTFWLNEAIPQDFMGRRVFEPLRAAAPRQVRFPAELPSVLALLPDPSGGVWVRTTTPANGERWVLVDERGLRRTIRLPPGRRLLAAGPGELAILAQSDEDVETVEVYRSPVTTARR